MLWNFTRALFEPRQNGASSVWEQLRSLGQFAIGIKPEHEYRDIIRTTKLLEVNMLSGIEFLVDMALRRSNI